MQQIADDLHAGGFRLFRLRRGFRKLEEVHAERVGHRQGTLFFNYQDPRRVVPCRY